MMNLEEARETMEKLGYSESARFMNNGKASEVCFYPTNTNNSLQYEVTVNLETEAFSFFHVVPRSCFVKVTLGPASPLSNIEHFKKFEKNFLEVINRINK